VRSKNKIQIQIRLKRKENERTRRTQCSTVGRGSTHLFTPYEVTERQIERESTVFIIYHILMAQRRFIKSNANWAREHLGEMSFVSEFVISVSPLPTTAPGAQPRTPQEHLYFWSHLWTQCRYRLSRRHSCDFPASITSVTSRLSACPTSRPDRVSCCLKI
jgi:hypothetical protein